MPAMIMGTSPATAIIDTANVDPVRSYICSMIATIVSCPPSPASVEPIHMRVNAGLVRNGRRSMKWLRCSPECTIRAYLRRCAGRFAAASVRW